MKIEKKTLKAPFYKSYIEKLYLEMLAFSQKLTGHAFQVVIYKIIIQLISK